jgi:hypothetical protein
MLEVEREGSGMQTDTKRSAANGKLPASTRTPRRIVLLAGDDRSEDDRVLVEYAAAEAHTATLGEDVDRFANEYRGRTVVAEWQGPRGWVRFLWSRKQLGEASAS